MVAISELNGCDGCTRVHRRWALRSGVTFAELETLRAPETAQLDPRSRAAVSYAVSRATHGFRGAPRAGLDTAARRHLSARELAYLDAVARAITLANLAANTILKQAPRPTHAALRPHLFARLGRHADPARWS